MALSCNPSLADRRRADDRARRHRAGPDPRAHPEAAPRLRLRRRADHARHGKSWPRSPTRAGDVCGRIVERGAKRDLFKAPRHPYTWGLLDSIPPLDGPRPRRLKSIAGMPPSLLDLPTGCAFGPRCRYRFDKCDERPGLAAAAATIPPASCRRIRVPPPGPGVFWIRRRCHETAPPLRRCSKRSGLSKNFSIGGRLSPGGRKTVRAVDNVSLQVWAGENRGPGR